MSPTRPARAPHQPDVGAVARLVEAFLNPEDAVAQGLVGAHLERRHAARGMEARAGRGGLWARACMYVRLLAGGPDSGAAAVSRLPAAGDEAQSREGRRGMRLR